ncbi:hypothetical protein [Yeosuana marina]|uniref:hypothetical protein n=1 Tax=Yeosuana marina TaxID=1565536 RepID=UPI0030ED0F00
MKSKKNYCPKILSLLFIYIPIIIIGQNSDKNTITFKSPSKNFKDITIQSHKGLPRLGDLYFHRGVTPPVNPNAYKMLIEMKYLTAIYADMDKNKITKTGNDNDLKVNNSIASQQHLLQLVTKLGTESFLKKYFCDTSNTTLPCTFTDANGIRKNIGRWGDSRNEFQQMRSYKAVVKNHLNELQNWSRTFFKDDQEIAYFVTQSMVVGKYDFKQKGYWLTGMGSGRFLIQKSQFSAYTDNEKKLKNQKMFFSIPPSKAKELNLQNRTPVFLVFKIKVIPKVSIPTLYFDYSFELDHKIIEIYKDIALTNEIGEINIDNAIFKY